jgi:hypothetical protein
LPGILTKALLDSARNEAQPVQQPELEDELDEFDILDSDLDAEMENADADEDFELLERYDA